MGGRQDKGSLVPCTPQCGGCRETKVWAVCLCDETDVVLQWMLRGGASRVLGGTRHSLPGCPGSVRVGGVAVSHAVTRTCFLMHSTPDMVLAAWFYCYLWRF